jgi:hypothetical protein
MKLVFRISEDDSEIELNTGSGYSIRQINTCSD